jgi:hypothetical protein
MPGVIKEATLIDLQYSYWYEFYLKTFWDRVDKGINILLLALSYSIVTTDVASFTAILIALLSAINIVLQPGRESLSAKLQAGKYQALIRKVALNRLTEAQLNHRLSDLHDSDHNDILGVEELACNRAHLSLGREPIIAHYTLANKIVSILVGDMPMTAHK